MATLFGKISSERPLVVNLSGPFEDVDGECLMISGGLP